MKSIYQRVDTLEQPFAVVPSAQELRIQELAETDQGRSGGPDEIGD